MFTFPPRPPSPPHQPLPKPDLYQTLNRFSQPLPPRENPLPCPRPKPDCQECGQVKRRTNEGPRGRHGHAVNESVISRRHLLPPRPWDTSCSHHAASHRPVSRPAGPVSQPLITPRTTFFRNDPPNQTRLSPATDPFLVPPWLCHCP